MPIQASKNVAEHLDAVCDQPLTDRLKEYLSVLTKYPDRIEFRTGAGRIFHSLYGSWPVIPGWEKEAQDMCAQITEMVYPLADRLFAQAVAMCISISPAPLRLETIPQTSATFVTLNAKSGLANCVFLSSGAETPLLSDLSIPAGIIVLCQPLNPRYHNLSDDRVKGRGGVNALPNKEWYNRNVDLPDESEMREVISPGRALPDVKTKESLLPAVEEALAAMVVGTLLPVSPGNTVMAAAQRAVPVAVVPSVVAEKSAQTSLPVPETPRAAPAQDARAEMMRSIEASIAKAVEVGVAAAVVPSLQPLQSIPVASAAIPSVAASAAPSVIPVPVAQPVVQVAAASFSLPPVSVQPAAHASMPAPIVQFTPAPPIPAAQPAAVAEARVVSAEAPRSVPAQRGEPVPTVETRSAQVEASRANIEARSAPAADTRAEAPRPAEARTETPRATETRAEARPVAETRPVQAEAPRTRETRTEAQPAESRAEPARPTEASRPAEVRSSQNAETRVEAPISVETRPETRTVEARSETARPAEARTEAPRVTEVRTETGVAGTRAEPARPEAPRFMETRQAREEPSVEGRGTAEPRSPQVAEVQTETQRPRLEQREGVVQPAVVMRDDVKQTRLADQEVHKAAAEFTPTAYTPRPEKTDLHADALPSYGFKTSIPPVSKEPVFAHEKWIVPHVAGASGAAHTAMDVSLLKLHPHHHVYDRIGSVSQKSPEVKPAHELEVRKDMEAKAVLTATSALTPASTLMPSTNKPAEIKTKSGLKLHLPGNPFMTHLIDLEPEE